MNKFNKRTGSAVKVRKVKARVTKKRVGAAQHHQDVLSVSSGKRTGKAIKKREKAANLKVRTAAPWQADRWVGVERWSACLETWMTLLYGLL
jgi:hypothetical protein